MHAPVYPSLKLVYEGSNSQHIVRNGPSNGYSCMPRFQVFLLKRSTKTYKQHETSSYSHTRAESAIANIRDLTDT